PALGGDQLTRQLQTNIVERADAGGDLFVETNDGEVRVHLDTRDAANGQAFGRIVELRRDGLTRAQAHVAAAVTLGRELRELGDEGGEVFAGLGALERRVVLGAGLGGAGLSVGGPADVDAADADLAADSETLGVGVV